MDRLQSDTCKICMYVRIILPLAVMSSFSMFTEYWVTLGRLAFRVTFSVVPSSVEYIVGSNATVTTAETNGHQ